MFNFLKKTLRIVAPITGRTVALSEVPDPVFSEKMAGDGIAILSTGNTVVSPCNGTITLLFDSNHAFAVTTEQGVEVLVHVGLDTVTLKGKGFHALHEIGDKVSAGAPVLELDREFIESQKLDLITPVLIINHMSLSKLIPLLDMDVTAGETPILEYKL